jgi:hypothetical protein
MAVSPFYRFMRRFDYPLDWRTWERLPRIPGYKNEYWDGSARLSPRPQTVELLLDLTSPLPAARPSRWSRMLPSDLTIRPLRDDDFRLLPATFFAAFRDRQPLASWNDSAARRAAKTIIEWTRRGNEGAVIREACFVATTSPDDDHNDTTAERIIGATIVTSPHSPAGDANPVDRPDKPHLTWIFVALMRQRCGIGNALLRVTVDELRRRDYPVLTSTCDASHPPSLLWHWRNGFMPRTWSDEA